MEICLLTEGYSGKYLEETAIDFVTAFDGQVTVFIPDHRGTGGSSFLVLS